VLTADELKPRSIALVLRFPTLENGDDVTKTSSSTETPFKMDSVVYEALRVVLRKRTNPDQNQHDDLNPKPTQFQKNSIALHIPNQCSSRGASAFFQAIVEYFARDVGAHLITLSIDDVEDIAEHFANTTNNSSETVESYMRKCFEKDEPTEEGLASKARRLRKKNIKVGLRALHHIR
jgi:hypothetical protein